MKPVSIARMVPLCRLSRGSTAEAWLVERRGERVVVKVYNEGPRSAHLARQECRAERLNHPNIARVIGGGVGGPCSPLVFGAEGLDAQFVAPGGHERVATTGRHYTVQEYAPGRPATCVFTWARMKARLRGVLLGLEHAHGNGLIHRDIKPDNVMVGEDGEADGVKIIDWGCCWDLGGGARNPFRSFAVGTPGYMPLEQVLGQSRLVGPWSDLYAVGALAHRMATGYAPIRGATAKAVMDAAKQVALDGAEMPNGVRSLEWGDGFVAWVGWLLAVPVSRRPQSAREALDVLESIEGPAGEG